MRRPVREHNPHRDPRLKPAFSRLMPFVASPPETQRCVACSQEWDYWVDSLFGSVRA